MILGEIKVELRWFCLRVIVQDDCEMESGLPPTGMGGALMTCSPAKMSPLEGKFRKDPVVIRSAGNDKT